MDDVARAPMTVDHHERLRAAGVDPSALDGASWTILADGLPQWWHENGNALYLAEGAALPPRVIEGLGIFPVRNVLIVIGSHLEWLSSLHVGGDDAIVFIGRGCALTAGEIYCGGASRIVLHGPVLGTRSPIVDARNGGSIVAQPDQLWAAHVYLATDDMHRLEDLHTRERINPFGADIRLGSHVWLGREVVVTGHAEIGDGAVIGMRSLVRGQKIPDHTVAVGSPARIVREGTTWSHDDVP